MDVFRRIEKRDSSPARIRWRWGIGVAIVMMFIALFPQIYLALQRGHQWHGANAISHPDEVAYSAYLASQIRGNPRRYDPFTHRGAQNEASAPESLFSIQFIPPCAIALPAFWFRLSASTVFVILPALCALASSFAIFWFVWLLTHDDRFSAASVPIILGLGTLIAGQGIVRHLLNLPYLIPLWISNAVAPTSLYHLPFLRLYQPAVAFPLFFVLGALVLIALTSATHRQALFAAAGAGLAFALLVFSYFYLWTAAASWLVCVGVMWSLAQGLKRKRTIIVFGIILFFAIAGLIPYFLMLGHRAGTVDAVQALVFSHRPDLFRLPEIASFLVLVVVAIGTYQSKFRWRDPGALIAVTLAASIIVDFNQQIITGRTLQPIHYEWFITNYCAILALVLTVATWSRGNAQETLPKRRLIIIAAFAIVWAFAEVWLAASVSFDYNRTIDEGKPVANRLAEIAASSEQGSSVLVSDLRLADRFPTDAPQPILWAPRMLVFPGVTETENRERFWRQLYYLGYDERKFWAELDHADWNFLTGMFPYERLSPVVGHQSPITPEEFRVQVASYLDYAKTFNRDRAAAPSLSYLIVHADREPDYANLDRWYQRDSGERIGGFVLYRLKLR